MNVDKILTFSGTHTKSQIVELARWHREQDLLIRGNYGYDSSALGEFNKGCSIGCMFSYRHEDGYKMAGVCPHLLYLVDTYFEQCKEPEDWHVWFWENLPEKVDSFEIFSTFMGKMLIDPNCGFYGITGISDRNAEVVSQLYLSLCTDKNQYELAITYTDSHTKYSVAAFAAQAYTSPIYAHYTSLMVASGNALTSYDRTEAYEYQKNLLKQVILEFKNAND